MSAWWLGLAPAEATVECSGAVHRLRWEAGELRAVDHDDAEGERALAALGGTRCACVDTLDAWARSREDLALLVYASRGPGDQLAAEDEGSQVAHAHPAARPAPPPDSPAALLGLGGGLPDRLVATVAGSWAHREDPAAAARLRAALYGRALAAVRAWLGEPRLELDLEVIPAGERRSLTRAGTGRLRAELPLAWLVDVGVKGLAVTAGRFCLAAETADGRRWTLLTVGADLGEPAEMTLVSPPAGTRS